MRRFSNAIAALVLVLVAAASADAQVGIFSRVKFGAAFLDATSDCTTLTTAPTGSICLDTDDGTIWTKGASTWSQSPATAAPTNATFITQTTNSTLSAEQALSALSTGLMKVTTGTGVVSSVTAPSGAVVGDTDTQTLTNKTLTCPLLAAGVQLCAATVTLTDAQVKALPTTPITIVAAPGAGKRIKVVSCQLAADTMGGAYTNLDATYAALAVYWLGNFNQWAQTGVVDDSAVPVTTLTNLLGVVEKKTTDTTAYLDAPGGGWAVPSSYARSAAENVALAIAIDNNGSGNLTGGNAANTLAVIVVYLVIG